MAEPGVFLRDVNHFPRGSPMNKPVFIARYHQSKFGNLMNMSVPDIVKNDVTGTCAISTSGV
jgi:hypothetical protein